MMLRIQSGNLIDEQGRTLLLRGVNLGGSSKVPFTPNGATYRLRSGFFDHRNVSFVGRPFPLQEADEHFRRLKTWGLTFVRFLVTWEAIEHSGPGIYDHEYMDYIRAVLEVAARYGIDVFIDPHEDVWSRFCGGDGAPGWTLEAVGMDLTRIQDTGAALIHNLHGDPLPRMIWPTNGHKLAAATMFALFFAGTDLAPHTRIEGESVQEYLQRHYIAAMRQLANRLKDLPNVVGFDTFNEPMHGYLTVCDLEDCCGHPRMGDFPTPLQAMLAASGQPVEINIWKFGLRGNHPAGRKVINPRGISLWREGFECVWRRNGVWDFDSQGRARLLRPCHFAEVGGRRIHFADDYYRPFANRFAVEIRAEMPNALIFIETEPGSRPPRWGKNDAADIVYAPHWYDGFTLVFKHFSPWVAGDFFTRRPVFLPTRIRHSFRDQLGRLKRDAQIYMGGAPVIVGEIGIPFDLDRKRAYRAGNFQAQERAMQRSLQALDDNLLSATLWNYTSDNSNARGDQWNDEDFSIFSRDQQYNPEDIHSGGRALRAVTRPYPRATAGTPLKLSFDMRSRRFEFEFQPDPAVQAPTEIFIPGYQYPYGIHVEAPDGTWEYDPPQQVLRYHPTSLTTRHKIRIVAKTI
jgi:hypothetical protein